MIQKREIPTDSVIEKLDFLLSKNDYFAAKEHLLYWLSEAKSLGDGKGELLIANELMGLCRKLSQRDEAIKYSQKARDTVMKLGIEENVGAATTYLNSATVYKAFGRAEESIDLFQKAKEIYENNLNANDDRLAGLYNNMALALVDLKRFSEARELYEKAINVLKENECKEPEQAITYLNLASAAEAEHGLLDAEDLISFNINKAMQLLDSVKEREDGNYAFVCEKCASVFGYYGFFHYEKELTERYRRIYERA